MYNKNQFFLNNLFYNLSMKLFLGKMFLKNSWLKLLKLKVKMANLNKKLKLNLNKINVNNKKIILNNKIQKI